MADSKSMYSEVSKGYVEANVNEKNYINSKTREAKHNNRWLKYQVNINDIIDRFAPDFHAEVHNTKYIFASKDYNIVTDMASGYLRIFDNNLKRYVTLDGTVGNDKNTHYKIKKREDM